jgi:hypothetical protein
MFFSGYSKQVTKWFWFIIIFFRKKTMCCDELPISLQEFVLITGSFGAAKSPY